MFSANLAVVLWQITSVDQDISRAMYYLLRFVHSHPGMVMLCTEQKCTIAIAKIACSVASVAAFAQTLVKLIVRQTNRGQSIDKLAFHLCITSDLVLQTHPSSNITQVYNTRGNARSA